MTRRLRDIGAGLRARTRWVVLGGMLAALAGCATLGMLGSFIEPVVKFKDLRLTGLGTQGGSLDITLNVYNPNRFDLEGVRLTYQLTVDDVRFGDGALDTRFIVRRGDSLDVRLPLNFTFAGIGAAGAQIVQRGAVNYTVNGDITVATPLGNFTRPYAQEARFTVFGGTTR
jgi:LEA14-like dessication related protein